MNKLGFWIASALVLLGLASSTMFVVDQRQFGVVYQLGEIKTVVTEPGLNFKLPPPFQNVSYIDRRLLTLESSDTEPIRNVGLTERAGALQLNRVIRNSFQEEVNRRTVFQLLSSDREALMADVKEQVLAAVKSAEKPWGMDVVDVRITRVDYAETITKSVYDRMEAERKRVANELRSTGAAEGERIRADADRQREIILAEAYRDAQTTKGSGDAEASSTYAKAFSRDPAFAKFYRSLEAYKSSFSSKGDIVVLDGDSDFLKGMKNNRVGPAK